MPIYEDRCQACDHPFEALVYGDEKPACPACGAKRLEKRFSSFGVGKTAGDAPACEGGSCPYGGDPGSCAMRN